MGSAPSTQLNPPESRGVSREQSGTQRTGGQPLSLDQSLDQSTVRRARDLPKALTPRDVLILQRMIGNQAVQRMLSDGTRPRDDSDTPAMAATSSPAPGAEVSTHGDSVIQRNPTKGKRSTKVEMPTEVEELEEEAQDEPLEVDTDLSDGVDEDSSHNAKALQHFRGQYDNVVGAHSLLHVDIGAKLAQFAASSKAYDVEDYSGQVFGNSKVMALLGQIQDLLDEKQSDGEVFAEIIADMLMFASLIPTSQQEHKQKIGRTRYTRLTAQVITIDRLVDILVQLAQQAAMGDEATEARSLAGIDFDDRDSVAQRMLKLSLVNMTKVARQNLQGNTLFKNMLASPDIMSVIIGSRGVFEQDFLNTCAAASINKEVQVNASNLASLLIVGRGVTNYIERELSDSKHSDQISKTHKRTAKFQRITLDQHARKRIDDARHAFDEMEEEASKIVTQRPVNVGELQALMNRWSRIMQKLSAITDFEKGGKSVPVLSKKRVKEHWMTSAVVATLTGSFLDRPLRRASGVEQGTYRSALSNTLDISTSANAQSSNNLNTQLGKDRTERTQRMSEVWGKIFAAGGTEFSVPGHELYLQAIMQDGKKVFMVSDPKISKSTFYTVEEMETYARKTKKGKFFVRRDLGDLPGGYLLENNVPFYTDHTKLGVNDPKSMIKLNRATRVLGAGIEKREGASWAKTFVKIGTLDVSGWIEPSKIRILPG